VATHNRGQALQTTFQSLQSSGSPPMLLACIQSGLQQWLSNPSLSAYVPPHDVLLKPKSTSALAAFSAQSTIGWEELLQGHMASQWNIASNVCINPRKTKRPHLLSSHDQLSSGFLKPFNYFGRIIKRYGQQGMRWFMVRHPFQLVRKSCVSARRLPSIIKHTPRTLTTFPKQALTCSEDLLLPSNVFAETLFPVGCNRSRRQSSLSNIG
jgi:hypothetical protein